VSGAEGTATLQYVVATAFVLVAFVGLTNLVVDLYARGAVRAAVDEAVRAGARVDASAAQCSSRARDVLTDLLGSRLRAGIEVSCAARVDVVTATADVRLPGWLLLPDWTFTVTGTAVKERIP
jgi:hypothetical protein